ncbi:hypothetical protein CQ052_21155 [Ochrobactrum sp. MYb15]|nr:hypothetical protein CQZ90_16875 [Ochrobactrum sp. MYb19]PRA53019.1 hypothetical protein CQ062_16300 [Ochrobactrum sp. MYb68]PRA63284.1 hypothetical protein CQ053_15405 [Ochrobactrum sp. MYb18]PRA73362.1 hypothetical protein CQ049_19980 [Brucella thiophenivorans]PRA88278.1 hypothetical protein CQ051_17320 [Ochrobactrum sp. MYb14]PRA94885.1 hypothetical protein CQ052_21155 [Ochrobactrum sp. MYb15]
MAKIIGLAGMILPGMVLLAAVTTHGRSSGGGGQRSEMSAEDWTEVVPAGITLQNGRFEARIGRRVDQQG